MKEHLKETFKSAYSHEAPKGFTDALMNKVTAQKKQYDVLIPKRFLWFFVLSFLAGIFAVVIVEGKNLNIGTDTLKQVLLVYYELFPIPILPLCIACLFFIQQVFHYRKIA